jgi:hypothetical protein
VIGRHSYGFLRRWLAVLGAFFVGGEGGDCLERVMSLLKNKKCNIPLKMR